MSETQQHSDERKHQMYVDVYYYGDNSRNVSDYGVTDLEHAQELARTIYADADEIAVKPYSLNDYLYSGLDDLQILAYVEPGTGEIH